LEVLSKDKIEALILPHVSKGKRGTEPRIEMWQVVSAILYRLKTGCQWRQLPVKQFFDDKIITWQGVYYHFRKWSSDGSFKEVWIKLLAAYHPLLDLSSLQLDGSQTLCKNGGEAVGYQGRKKANTCNALFFCDNEGLPLAMATPQGGQQHDLHDIQTLFEELCQVLTGAGIELRGVFMNADSGFDAEILRQVCIEKELEANIYFNPRYKRNKEGESYLYFDEDLYKRRFVIERMNAWLDGFKALLIRFETKVNTWMALHLLAFITILSRKIKC